MAEIGRLASLQEWAAQILGTAEDPVACENASVSHRLASDAVERMQRQDRHAMAALDHIDDLMGDR